MPLDPARCPRCLFRREACLCPVLPRLVAPVPFSFLRHASEIEKPTNTARWAALAIENATLVEYALSGAPFDDGPLREPGAVLLWPEPGVPLAGPPARVVVVDATWSQARRMVHKVPALREMPRLVLPGDALPARRLRRPPRGGMSTIEAAARAFEALGDPAGAAALDALHDAALARIEKLRGFPLPSAFARRPL